MDTYGSLQTEVVAWLNRTDLDFKIPTFVRLAETEIYRNLRCQDNEFLATYTQTSVVIDSNPSKPATPGNFKALPQNFVEMKLVKWNGRRLRQCSDQQMATRLDKKWDAEVDYFSMHARRIDFSESIANDPASWSANDNLVYHYYGTESLCSLPTWHVATNPVDDPVVEDIVPQALIATAENTTRMLQRNPDLYLNGTLYYASLFLKSKEVQVWGPLFKAGLEELRMETAHAMIGGSTQEVSSGENI